MPRSSQPTREQEIPACRDTASARHPQPSRESCARPPSSHLPDARHVGLHLVTPEPTAAFADERTPLVSDGGGEPPRRTGGGNVGSSFGSRPVAGASVAAHPMDIDVDIDANETDAEIRVDRLACVHVPALPLQLLVRRHPEWMERPVAVVDEDKPQGKVLWVNEAAYRSRVLPGTRYAAGLSLCKRLCAGEVHEEEIDQGVQRLLELLWRFSPEVEPSREEPGVFWLNASGMERIEESLGVWARRLRAELERDGFLSRVAVGYRRFASYAAARVSRDVKVFDDEAGERHAAMRVRLDRLHIEPRLRESLAKLDVYTVQEFLELPPDGLGKRFGAEAVALFKEASAEGRALLVPAPPPVPVQTLAEFEYPEADATRLLFYMKRLLPDLFERLASWHQGLIELVVEMTLDDGLRVVRSVRPADATLDVAVILDLVRLRLGVTDLSAGVVEMTVTAHGKRVDAGQLSLFWSRPKRDITAADRALARLRAEFGRDAVVWAKPRDAHLPEASFTWEPLRRMKPLHEPRNGADDGKMSHGHGTGTVPYRAPERRDRVSRFVRPLVRRMFDKPVQLPARERHEPDGWLIRGLEQGPAVRLRGPYVVSGGWWVREVHREYYFVETQRGDVLWIYYDRHRRHWMLQGEV